MRTLVVVPTYIEAPNIAEALRRLRAAVPDADVLVVDDNSPDGTADIAQAMADELGHIDVLRRDHKGGLGSAYRAGFAIGVERGYEVLCQMDADLSHDAAALPALLGKLEEGYDLAVGSRYVPGGSIPHWPLHRRLLSRWGNRYTNAMLGVPIRDATSGYRAYRAEALERADYANSRATGYGFQIELAYRVWSAGGKIAEVPISFTDRVRGYSKMNGKIIAEEMWLVSWWGIRDRTKHLAERRKAR